MARLAGQFAGIVVVTVPDDRVTALTRTSRPLQAQGLLDVRVSAAATTQRRRIDPLSLELVGEDRPGIVARFSRALAARDVSIEELRTVTREAPMAGGMLFEATATLLAPPSVPRPTSRLSSRRSPTS